jgi:hypothetical protein
VWRIRAYKHSGFGGGVASAYKPSFCVFFSHCHYFNQTHPASPAYFHPCIKTKGGDKNPRPLCCLQYRLFGLRRVFFAVNGYAKQNAVLPMDGWMNEFEFKFTIGVGGMGNGTR